MNAASPQALLAIFSLAAFSINSAFPLPLSFGGPAVALAKAGSIQPSALPPRPPEVLRAVRSMPAHIAGTFNDLAACHLTPDGDFLVFDRRAHSVYRVPPNSAPKQIVQIGVEPGRILLPLAFDSAPDGSFVIADAPTGIERIQIFYYLGGTVGGFTLPGRSVPRVALGDLVLSGLGSLEYTGTSVLVSQPASGALVSEYGLEGRILRTFGELRPTGHEQDLEVHLALNAGMTVAVPDSGGFYFVFLSGVPMFRKYDADGTLLFERHIEGPELDRHIQTLPSLWPRRRATTGEFAIVPPSVRTAAVDSDGNLWLSLITPYTYVYDAAGDKRRTIQFQAAGILAASNLYFTKKRQVLVSPGCYTFNAERQP
jgi:hypothetical protein